MVDPDQLADAEAAEVLQGFDVAEPGDGVQELHGSGRQTWIWGKKMGFWSSARAGRVRGGRRVGMMGFAGGGMVSGELRGMVWAWEGDPSSASSTQTFHYPGNEQWNYC